MKTSKYEIDMCNGSIMDKLISFSLPLMLSSILQLMFNAVDIIVVGRFDSSQALAAVGSTTALINIFTNLFIGISLGANVLAARYFAAGRDKEMSEAVHTAITLALISGVIMAFVGAGASRLALDLMDTPADVIDQSVTYMRIYFMGMPFFMLYNYGAAVLRAVGDTKRPLLFLATAGMANVALDLLLVIVIPLGVAGVAIGTVSSQFVSCILVLWCLHRSDGSYQLRFSKLTIKWIYLKRIFQVGIPAGIQSTVINFSNAMLQSSVNSFGSTAMAGYTAANNVLGFLYVSVNAVTQACMSFTSQNYSVGKQKRMDRILLDCMILSAGVSAVLGVGAYIFGCTFGQKYGRKLFPEISPKKSWIGFWGGFAVAILVAVGLHYAGLLRLSLMKSVAIGIVINISGVYGDLIESQWKRHYSVKDSGKGIPGHGGYLDRFDSALTALPMGIIFIEMTRLL